MPWIDPFLNLQSTAKTLGAILEGKNVITVGVTKTRMNVNKEENLYEVKKSHSQ